MKRTVSKPSYGIPQYNLDDPFDSLIKRMHRTCDHFRSTWDYPVVTSPVDYQHPCKHLIDLTNIQFEEKYLENKDTLENGFGFEFAPFLPNIEQDQMKKVEFPEHEFKLEMISTKDLLLFKPEPWNNLIYEENLPPNTLFEEMKRIPVQPLQFDDPLQMSPPPLSLAISSENIVPQTPLALANLKMSPKDLTYPETPACDYFMEFLVPLLGDLCIAQDAEPKEEVLHQPVAEVNKQDLATKLQFKSSSPPHSTTFENNETSPTNNPPALDQAMSNIEICPSVAEKIVLELPNFATDTVRLMEDHLSLCLKNLADFNISFITDLLKSCRTLAELKPSTTRAYLCKVKEEISNASLDPSRQEYGKTLEKLLPILLSLHGVNKALEIFLNIDYDMALETLADFQKTHEKILESDYKLLLFRLLRQLPGNRTELHPKLTEVRAIVLEHLRDDTTGRKIWIRLRRHASEVGSRILQLLVVADIPCDLDPQISETPSVFLPSGKSPVIIAEEMPKDFPPSMLSLIIHYEQPCGSSSEMDWRYASVAQKVLEINRPVCKELVPEPIAPQSPSPIATSNSNLSPKTSSPKAMDESTSEFDEPDNEPTNETFTETQADLDLNLESREESVPEPQSQAGDEDGQEPTTEIVYEAANVADTAKVESISDEPCEVVPIVLSSNLKNNPELMEAFKVAGNLLICDCDYEFLSSCAKYQPDVLVCSKTAILIIYEDDDFQEIRLKILATSFKCSKCWILLLAPSIITSSKPPAHWFLLAKLTRFYEKKSRGRAETRFQLKSRLALNYHQVTFIIKDIARDQNRSDIRSDLYPLSDEAKLLLRFEQLNAVSAPLISEHFSAMQILTLPVDLLCNRIPHLRNRIKIFRYCQQMKREQQVALVDDMDEDLCFGKIKPVWRVETENQEQCVSLQSPSPNKRAKRDVQCQEEFKVPLNVSQLRNMWDSPYPSNQST